MDIAYSPLPTIHVYYHVVIGRDSQHQVIQSSNVSEVQLRNQTDVLNAHYNSYGIYFEFVGRDEIENACNGIQSSNGGSYYKTFGKLLDTASHTLAVPESMRWLASWASGGHDALVPDWAYSECARNIRSSTPYKGTDLHVYTNTIADSDVPNTLGCTMMWPWTLNSTETRHLDGILLHHDVVPGNSRFAANRGVHNGEVLVHEVRTFHGMHKSTLLLESRTEALSIHSILCLANHSMLCGQREL